MRIWLSAYPSARPMNEVLPDMRSSPTLEASVKAEALLVKAPPVEFVPELVRVLLAVGSVLTKVQPTPIPPSGVTPTLARMSSVNGSAYDNGEKINAPQHANASCSAFLNTFLRMTFLSLNRLLRHNHDIALLEP